MKKFISILLALVLVLALAACGSNGGAAPVADPNANTNTDADANADPVVTPEPTPATIYGTWEANLDLIDQFVAGTGDETVGQYIKSFPVLVTIEFREDNTCTMTVDGTAAADSLKDGLGQYLVASVKESSGVEMSLEDIEAAMGYTVADLVDQLVSAFQMTQDGTFPLDGNNFVINEDGGKGSFEGDTMKLDTENEELGEITLTRK